MDNPWADADPVDDGPVAHGSATPPPDDDPWTNTVSWVKQKPSAVPLDSLLRHCQQVSQEIWPALEAKDQGDWRSGFSNHADLAALLPADETLPPAVQFSATATARAMNDALKLTRHLPTSSGSPLSRLLSSKGSLDWEKSIRADQDVIQDVTHVGWKVLEKDDRLGTPEESKQRKVTGGLLSFWNRRASGVQPAQNETQNERTSSPTRTSQESVQSHPQSSRAASPSKTSVTLVPPPPPADPQAATVAAAPSAPSAVSRFLNRFSRARGTQHSALALSADDLEFLSDIIPSATDPTEEDGNLDALTRPAYSSPLPPRLPPPIPPPPRQPSHPSRPSSAFALDTPDSGSFIGTAFQMNGVSRPPNVPILPPPPSPKPTASFSRAQSPSVASGQSSSPLNSRPNSRPQSSFAIPPPQPTPLLLSIPPLLPPPPVSPPQTPRPTTISSMMQSTHVSSYHDSYDSDDEFSEFTSFPPSAPAPFPSLEPRPSQEPPSPPSPPPRRSYERTHYPSSSSASSIFSPTSQSSLDHLCPPRSSISAPLDSFDDFVSPSLRGENRKRTPSPPPLPIKPQQQRLDTSGSRVYHAHTPSQTLASPTVHTSLINGTSLAPSVSLAEHRRTQTLVNHAAARGGLLWPNSPDMDEPRVTAMPPPPSASTSPKSLLGQEGFDLLGGDDAISGALEALPPWWVAEKGSGVLFPSSDASHSPFGAASGPDNGFGLRNQLQPSPPRVPSTSASILSFSALGTSGPLVAMNPGSQPAKPKQTGGLSAQDLSFFEGL